MRPRVKMHGDLDIGQIARMYVRRIWADENRLAYNRCAFADDHTAAATVIRAPNLTPLAPALELNFAELEEHVHADRVDQTVVDDRALAAFEPRFTLGRADELDFEILGGEQTLVPRDQPRERKDRASGDVVGDFFRQPRLPMRYR